MKCCKTGEPKEIRGKIPGRQVGSVGSVQRCREICRNCWREYFSAFSQVTKTHCQMFIYGRRMPRGKMRVEGVAKAQEKTC